MSDVFFIKRGDRLPAIAVDLIDADGSPVDLTGATLKFSMTADDGTLVVDDANAATGALPGRVLYYWQAGDTDITGNYQAEFTVTIAGETQTYPTNGFTRVQVVPDLADIIGVPVVDIDRLRRMIGEYEVATLSVLDLANYLEQYPVDAGYDIPAAASAIWTDKAAGYAELIDVTEGGSTRALSKLHEQALTMAQTYWDLSDTLAGEVVVTRATHIRSIVRP